MITDRQVLRFWIPLSSTWLMMAAEGPVLAAVVARLDEKVLNLAAYGIASAVAMLIESPVIGLLSAVVALVRDKESAKRMFRFMVQLNLLVTAVMVIAVIPPVFDVVAHDVIQLPANVAWRVYVGLVCMIPWPAAIGVRRYYQGLLIRAGRTRSVALGTVIRLVSMATSAFALAAIGVEGVIVGCVGLTIGVVNEAVAIWWLTTRVTTPDELTLASTVEPLTSNRIRRFYTPLALTSMVNFFATPLLSFLVIRLPDSVASLAVIPVISALLFVFRSFGFSYQEVGIALLGPSEQSYRAVRRVAQRIVLGTTIAMGIIVGTPLLEIVYRTVFELQDQLVQLATAPTRVLMVVPLTAALYSLQRAVMIVAHRTIHVTASMLIEVGTMALVMVVFIWNGTLNGALASGIAIAVGSVFSFAYAGLISRSILRQWPDP